MIFEQKIGLILTATARYTVVVAHLHLSFVSFAFYQVLFYARDPIITRDGFETTGVIGNG
jgi:hypothetical protein